LKREDIFLRYPWLSERNVPIIISTTLDGILSAAFLRHYLGWQVVGYYDCTTLWLGEIPLPSREKLVWVDIAISHPLAKAIGRQLIAGDQQAPAGSGQHCNPNQLAGINLAQYGSRYPFSTIILLLWLYNKALRRDLMARLLVLQARGTWLNLQYRPAVCADWQNQLPGYDWKWLFAQVDTEKFERRMSEQLYPYYQPLAQVRVANKILSRWLQLPLLKFRFNPDWDEDGFLQMGNFIGTHLKWSPPRPAVITQRIEGERHTMPVKSWEGEGFAPNPHEKGVFSHAATGCDQVSYTLLNW